jgi:hypothetical protein
VRQRHGDRQPRQLRPRGHHGGRHPTRQVRDTGTEREGKILTQELEEIS